MTTLMTAVFFLFIFSAILAVGYYLTSRQRPSKPVFEPAPEWAMDAAREPESATDHIAAAFQRLGQAVPRKKQDRDPLQKALIAAGYRSTTATHVFYGIKLASAALLAFVLAWVALMAANSWNAAIAAILIGGVIGYILPERVLDAYISARGSKMRAALPSALDIIALSIEAGQPMDQAIEASSHELRRVYPELSMEFSGIQRELRAGKSRIEALTDVSNRNREVELKKVCKLLIDGDRFGTTLAPALRNHAKYLRLRSRQKAQEAARKVSVKLIFPVFFLIFPAVILITLGPAVIQISTMLNGLF